MKPFFSVIIPTYKRPQTLAYSIQSVLNQRFDDFELLVLDDVSQDETENVVSCFRNKRLKYIKNNNNLGYARNLMKGMNMAKGKYLFLLGDDDFILKDNTFSQMYKELIKTKAGFAQTKLLFYDEDYTKPYLINRNVEGKIYFYPSREDILVTILPWHLGFVSGTILKRELIKKGDLIPDIWYVYFKAIFRCALNSGCIYFGNQYIIARVSKNENLSYMNLYKNKGFYYNKLFKIYHEFESSRARLDKEKKWYLDRIIKGLMGTKYYTSNTNIIGLAKGVVDNDNRYLYNFNFWFNVAVSLLTPKFVFSFFRKIYVKGNQRKINVLLKNVQVQKHITKLRFDT